VTRLGRPLPVEYLLVDVPVSTPLEPQFTFAVREGKTLFPTENRPMAGHLQVICFVKLNISVFKENYRCHVKVYHCTNYQLLKTLRVLPVPRKIKLLTT